MHALKSLYVTCLARYEKRRALTIIFARNKKTMQTPCKNLWSWWNTPREKNGITDKLYLLLGRCHLASDIILGRAQASSLVGAGIWYCHHGSGAPDRRNHHIYRLPERDYGLFWNARLYTRHDRKYGLLYSVLNHGAFFSENRRYRIYGGLPFNIFYDFCYGDT